MPRRTHKRWTVLIYMVADDPQGGELLDQKAVQEMDQITRAALSPESADLHVALQVDFRTLPGVWRRVIGESTFVRPEGDAADPATLYGFFDWAANECPADRYLLIFWGHSRGQFGIFGDPDPFDYTAQTLTLDELGQALRAARRSLGKAVDVIAFKDCYMATLETAYELSGLADYLVASPGLVPVTGWPYEEMFEALTKGNPGVLKAASGILSALGKYYEKDANKGNNPEVPYSLLSTRGASAVVDKLGKLIGVDRRQDTQPDDKVLRPQLDDAANRSGDPALVDLGALVPAAENQKTALVTSLVGGTVSENQKKDFDALADALGNARAASGREAAEAAGPEPLVISHTGKKFGGVNVFVYPSSAKGQRNSMLTRLADEKAYRRLAISTDTNWADIALQHMPIQPARPRQDVSAAIALLEQLQRLGVTRTPGSAEAAHVYLRGLARRAQTGTLTESELTEAAEYSAIAELASRLAVFAADKGGANFLDDKGGANFGPKGGANFAAKGGANFGPG